MKIDIWFTIEKSGSYWVVWKNKEGRFSYGSFGIYKSEKKKDCINYCKQNKINYIK